MLRAAERRVDRTGRDARSCNARSATGRPASAEPTRPISPASTPASSIRSSRISRPARASTRSCHRSPQHLSDQDMSRSGRLLRLSAAPARLSSGRRCSPAAHRHQRRAAARHRALRRLPRRAGQQGRQPLARRPIGRLPQVTARGFRVRREAERHQRADAQHRAPDDAAGNRRSGRILRLAAHSGCTRASALTLDVTSVIDRHGAGSEPPAQKACETLHLLAVHEYSLEIIGMKRFAPNEF